MTDWDRELSKIDRQLASIPDAPGAAGEAAAAPPEPGGVDDAGAARERLARRTGTRTWGAFVRLALATALGIAILFWPYGSRCGGGLAVYLLAIAAVVTGGLWSAVWTWRHQTARAHVLSLLLVLWGLTLAAVEVLPRAGYAKADAARPVGFACPLPAAESSPAPPGR